MGALGQRLSADVRIPNLCPDTPTWQLSPSGEPRVVPCPPGVEIGSRRERVFLICPLAHATEPIFVKQTQGVGKFMEDGIKFTLVQERFLKKKV